MIMKESVLIFFGNLTLHSFQFSLLVSFDCSMAHPPTLLRKKKSATQGLLVTFIKMVSQGFQHTKNFMLWNDEFLPKSSTTMTTMCGFLSLESGVKKKRARKVNPAAAFIFESNCRILLRLYQGSFRKSISWDIDIFNRAITSVESPTFFIGSENQKKYDFKKCLDIFIGEKIRLNSQYSFTY